MKNLINYFTDAPTCLTELQYRRDATDEGVFCGTSTTASVEMEKDFCSPKARGERDFQSHAQVLHIQILTLFFFRLL